MTTSTQFIESLLQLVPELRPTYDEHLADNDTLLPHVFMGDVTRFVIAETQNPKGQDVLARLLDHLDVGLTSGDEEVKELIVVSFVENLRGETAALKAIRSLMGSNLKKEVETISGS